MKNMYFNIFGKSGCLFYIKNNCFIKKSKNINYNKRLYNQYIKQTIFYKDNFYFKTPFPISCNNGIFIMKYIKKSNMFHDYIINNNTKVFYNKLINFLSYEFDNSEFINNININDCIKKIKLLNNQSNKYTNYLLNNIPDKIYYGTCHGDLTLSNILFTKTNFYLIDFLDNFIESPIFDLVKLRQDTYHKYYINILLKENNKLLNDKLNELDNLLINKFNNIINSKDYIWFSILNLLRIIPYLKNKEDINYIKSQLKLYNNYII